MNVIGTDEMEGEKFVLLYSKCVPYIKITRRLFSRTYLRMDRKNNFMKILYGHIPRTLLCGV